MESKRRQEGKTKIRRQDGQKGLKGRKVEEIRGQEKAESEDKGKTDYVAKVT